MNSYTVNGRELCAKIQIVDECNLNCVGCDHFAPVAAENHVSVSDFTKTVMNLRRITENHVREVIIYGGEPLLHEQLAGIIRLTTVILPKAMVTVETNGTLLGSWLADHWPTMTKLNVTFKVTEYEPTHGVLERLINAFPKVKFEQTVMPSLTERSVNFNNVFKTSMFNVNLTRTPSADSTVIRANCYCKVYEPFSICVRANHAYACPLAMCLPIADAEFDVGLYTAAGGVDLDHAVFDDLQKVAVEPIPLCAHCGKLTYGVLWSTSTKSSGEWFSTTP